MQTNYKVVDLGTKKGSAIGVFVKRGKMYYGPGIPGIRPAECLGIDIADKYQETVEKRGYRFLAADILSGDFVFPDADYYLAWDFLEHLTSIHDSQVVLRWMLSHAKKGVWLKMPSFEQDERGEGQLREHGLRFTWTNWHGHPSFFKVSDAAEIIQTFSPKQVKHKFQRIIEDSSSKFVVPIDAPVDTTEYTKDLGPKPKVRFSPSVIGCHELIVYLE